MNKFLSALAGTLLASFVLAGCAGIRSDSKVGALSAQYIEDWRRKVETVGALNYPEVARGKLYGSVVVYVEINRDGELIHAEVQRSSGHQILDDAALRILRQASPFSHFSPQMRQYFDVLAFTRTWTFLQGDQLQSQ